MEEWRNIDEYEGLYQISNYGRVKSTQYHNGTYERILKPSKHTDGYPLVNFCKNRQKKWYLVHRLVAQAFIPNPNNLPCVNHKDECKTNNNVDNLEWCTRKYNSNYGTAIQRTVEKKINGKTSKKVYQYTLDGEFVSEYPSTHEVERQLGYANQNINRCCRGKRPTAYGYIWKYSS